MDMLVGYAGYVARLFILSMLHGWLGWLCCLSPGYVGFPGQI